MTTRDSNTAANLAFQAEIASAKARRDRDQPRHSATPPRPAPTAPEPTTDAPAGQAPGIGGKAA